MKALVFTQLGKVTLQEVTDPEPGPDQAVIRVAGAGICASDIVGLMGGSARRRPPLVLGHELIGTLTHLPAGDWNVRVGQRVVANPLLTCGQCEQCRGGRANICASVKLLGMDDVQGAFAEYVTVQAQNIFPVAAGVSDTQAVTAEPLAVALHAFTLLAPVPLGSLAIYGMGAQGMLLLQLARVLGYSPIIAVDPKPRRLELAKQTGATHVVGTEGGKPSRQILDCTGGRGVDVVIDAAGTTSARADGLHSARKGGQVVLLGNHQERSEVEFALAVRKELIVRGSYAYTNDDFAAALRRLESGKVSIEPWTQTRPLELGQDAFDFLLSKPPDVLKVVLRP